MAADTAGVDRTLGAIGTTFRLMRLYPPTHPAVIEALRQIGEALPALAALGTVEWKVGVTGLHWHGQHLLPRNAQIAELAGLLYARGVRQQVLPVPVQPGDTHFPLHGAQRREGGKRLADLPQRLDHRRVGRRVQPHQAERRPDGAECAVDSCGIRCHGLALDPLSLVFEPEYPRGETCGLDRVVRADRHPVAVAAGVGSATGPTRVLSEHLLSPLDPQTELVRSQVHPSARRGGPGITAVSRDHHDAAAVQPLAVRREN